MATIAADPLHSVFSKLKDVTEIRDANGNILGVYTPAGKAVAATSTTVLIVFEDGRSVQFDLKQANERLAMEKTRPFRDMIDRLESLAEKNG